MARHFDNWLRGYMTYTRASEAPDSLHFWTGVATIAGVLRRRVWIEQRYFQWTPNFYIVLVGPPGVVTKSTTVRIGMKLLEQVVGVRFGPQSLTWQALAMSLSESVEFVKFENARGEESKIPMSCLTIPVSELGTFLKPDDAALIDVLVAMWDGQQERWEHKTRTAGAMEIRNPWLNVIGCTTPAWLRANFPEHLIGGGLTSRVVFVYADKKRQFVAYPARHIDDAAFAAEEAKLVSDLKEIGEIIGEYYLSPDAIEWGEAWYAKLWSDRPPHMASERYSGYLARKQTHVHKLGIILAAARSSQRIIDRPHLEEALAIVTDIEPDMIKVFESIGIVNESKQVSELVPFVRAHGTLTSDELWSFVQNIMSQKDFIAALQSAVRGGQFTVTMKDGKHAVTLPKRTVS